MKTLDEKIESAQLATHKKDYKRKGKCVHKDKKNTKMPIRNDNNKAYCFFCKQENMKKDY